MRALQLLIACALLFAALPLSSQEPPSNPDIVKAEYGLSYAKPAGWVASSGKRGAVSTLKRTGDDPSSIEFRFAAVKDRQAESYFTTFHSSLSKARLERVSVEGKSYGKLDGRLTEYKIGSEKPRVVFVFEFVTPTGAWLVVGMFDGAGRTPLLEVFETMLQTLAFE